MAQTRSRPIVAVINDWGSVSTALEESGAETVNVATTSDLKLAIKWVDAIVLTGGADIEPSWYGDEKHPAAGGYNKSRDDLEFEAVLQAQKRRLPMMGICRGHQLLNVAYGGTLIQHIPDLPHAHYHESTSHAVKLRSDARVARSLGVEALTGVTSLHHQGLGTG
jgi:putative glutamine amidotransferase